MSDDDGPIEDYDAFDDYPDSATVPEATWLGDAIERWGKPRINYPVEMRVSSEHGPMWRRCWVWFPVRDGRPVNTHISIDHFKHRGGADHWVVTAGAHDSPWGDATRTFGHDPTDADVRMVISRGWPADVD